MVSKLWTKGSIPKTERRRKSDVIKRNKKKARGSSWNPEDCEWTVLDSGPTEMPDLPDLIL